MAQNLWTAGKKGGKASCKYQHPLLEDAHWSPPSKLGVHLSCGFFWEE